jgi:acyl-CoA synthetase (NDP forming)/GNAT superfamily N-acetyltransferase
VTSEPNEWAEAGEDETRPPGYPGAWEADTLLVDGTGVRVRPVRPSDATRLVEFHASLSAETIHRRFFSAHPQLSPEEARRFTTVDYVERMALIAQWRGRLVAVARYERLSDTSAAELAVVVADEFQGRGVGTVLIEQLAAYARSRGIERFVAETLASNVAMLGVFDDLGLGASRIDKDGTVVVTIELAPTPRYLAARDARERRAISKSLVPLLEPQSVAVIGAGRRPGSAGHEILRSLLAYDFAGRVYPVNPHARSICGVPAYPEIGAVPEEVDLALIAVPAKGVVAIAQQCAKARVRSLCVISSGFAETGPEGLAEELALLEVARRHGQRLLGPNCLGLVNTEPKVRMDASFAPVPPSEGNVALASQSGAIGVLLLERMREVGLGLSAFVSMGNKADVSSNDLLCAWEDDERTRAIALYLESFGNPRKFARIARRVTRKKPIIVLKSGTTAAGQRGARSHSAAAATPTIAVEELLRTSGVVQVNGLDELIDVVTLAATCPVPAGRRVALVGNSGGPLVLAADACERAGLAVPELQPETAAAIAALAPPSSATGNPVDLTSEADAACLEGAVSALLAQEAIDAVVAIVTPLNALSALDAKAALAQAARTSKPVVACLVGADAASASGQGGSGSFGVIASPERAASALGRLARYGEWLQRPEPAHEVLAGIDTSGLRTLVAEFLAARPEGGWLGAGEVWSLLKAASLPVVASEVVADADAAVEAAGRLGFPVALKAASGELVHKSDVGAVVLGIGDPDTLRGAYAEIQRRLQGVGGPLVVQPMVPQGLEVIVGMSADVHFGPLVVFGLGGVATDLLGDHSFGVPPITHDEALSMLHGLRASALLTGYRGSEPVALEPLADVVRRVGALSELCPEIVELDCNPVIASASGVVIVDAKVRLARPVDAPDQLSRTLRRPVHDPGC